METSIVKRRTSWIMKRLKDLIELGRTTFYLPEYQTAKSEEEILGVIVAKYLQWQGKGIITAFSYALEDANYHVLAKQVLKLLQNPTPFKSEVNAMSTNLGKASCGECEGSKTLEVTDGGMIRSRCLTCGFVENEWLFGDEPDYLNTLAQRYHVTVEQIREALKGKTKTPTEIQKTILQQLKTLNPFLEKLYGVKNIIAMADGRTLRLHTRNNGKAINIDIIYHRVPDLYEIKAYYVNAKTLECKPLKTVKDVFCDQTDTIIHEILHEHAGIPLRYIEP